MLEIQILKHYPAFKLDVTFNTTEGMVTGLFGRSGSGKTSIINSVAGLATPDSGKIVVGGRTLYDSRQKINLSTPERNSGYIFQDGRLFPHMTVEANLKYGMKRSSAKASFDDIVDLLGIAPLLKRRPHKLSGGEKQRAAIGRALLSSPDFLLMDEPLSALDSGRKYELIPFIGKMVQAFKLPVLYVTHSIDELYHLCDNMVLLNNGKCEDAGTVEEVVSKPENRKTLGLSGSVSVMRAVAVRENSSSTVELKDGRLLMPTCKYSEGTELRVAVHSDDVTLAIKKPEGISARNIIKGRVKKIVELEDGITVTVDAGLPIYASVTKAAVAELQIKEGMEIYAILKTTALSRLSVPYIH